MNNTETKDNEINGKAMSAILEDGVDFSVNVVNPNMLHKLGILKARRTFIVKPICLGTLIRISKIMLEVERKELDLERYLKTGFESAIEYSERFGEIAALAVTNDSNPPSKRLVSFFIRNLSSGELLKLINLIIRQMDVSDFLLSIVTAKGLNLTRKPPEEAGTNEEKSTSGKPSEE